MSRGREKQRGGGGGVKEQTINVCGISVPEQFVCVKRASVYE